MRVLLLSAVAAAALAACSPPASTTTTAETTTTAPTQAACNDVAPGSNAVTLGDEAAVAAAVADLRGGRVTPGTYDLVSGNKVGGASGWPGARAVALNVSESDAGTIFNWASTAPDDRWSAGFVDAPGGHLTYTCGRSGGADIDFTARADGLQMTLPEPSGAGSLYLVFARRS